MSDVEFAKRLKQACDQNQAVPPYGHGRQAFVAKKLKVTQEAVRKWFTGDSRPKPRKMTQLAHLLESDEAWLALGVQPEVDRREKRSHGTKTEGAVFFGFGLMTMAGASAAFPSPGDPRSEYVDFYAIYQGAQYPIHISLGREVSKNVYEFIVPKEYEHIRTIGVVQLSHTRYHLLNLSPKFIDRHKQRKGGDFAVSCGRKGSEYATGADTWPRVESFGDIV